MSASDDLISWVVDKDIELDAVQTAVDNGSRIVTSVTESAFVSEWLSLDCTFLAGRSIDYPYFTIFMAISYTGIVKDMTSDPFDLKLKVRKADGSEDELSAFDHYPTKEKTWSLLMVSSWQFQLDPELFEPGLLQIGASGSQFVKLRIQVGIKQSALDPFTLLPPQPAPYNDVAGCFVRYAVGGNGTVKLVSAVEEKEFDVYKDLLMEASEVFGRMLETDMQEASKSRVPINGLCGDGLAELIYFLSSRDITPARFRQHVLELLDVAECYLLSDLKLACERAIVGALQQKTLPADVLDLMKKSEMYDLSVAKNVGLCRILKHYEQLSDVDKQRLMHSDDFASIRENFASLASKSHKAKNC